MFILLPAHKYYMIGDWLVLIFVLLCGISVYIFCGWFDKKMGNDNGRNIVNESEM